MLEYIGTFEELFGPLRLFEHYSFLILTGLYLGFFLSFTAIKHLSGKLPHDRGREFAVESRVAVGKPTGAGVLFVGTFALVSVLVVPMNLEIGLTLGLTILAMLSGYLDDRSPEAWSEYKKGVLDLSLALAVSCVLGLGKDTTFWLPFTKQTIEISSTVFIPVSTVLVWLSINTTNCSDGVDGLSATLVLMSLVTIGVFMYFVIGHQDISAYLLLPHHPDGARWAVLIFSMVGSLTAYLWFNAYPSKLLMGDAGSRALGFILGVAIIKTGNPFLYLIVATVLLVNGGTGLLKVAFLRFLNIRIFHNTRFPLHDHMREYLKWSNTQVLIKFVIIQLLITIGMLGVFIKIR